METHRGLLIRFLLLVTHCVGIRHTDHTSLERNASSTSCNTPSCLELAESIRERIDDNIDPCEDFYTFACGGEIKKRQAELDADPSQPEMSNAMETNRKVQGMIMKILDPSTPISDSPIAKYLKTAQTYQSECIKKMSDHQASLEDVKEVIGFALSIFGNWSPGDGWDSKDITKFSEMIGMLAKTDFPSPIRLDDGFDVEHPSRGIQISISAHFRNLIDPASIKVAGTIDRVKNLHLTETVLPDFYTVDSIQAIADEFKELIDTDWREDPDTTTTTPPKSNHNFRDLDGLKSWWEQMDGFEFDLLDWDVIFRAISPAIYEAVKEGAQLPYTTAITVASEFGRRSYGTQYDPIEWGIALNALYRLGPKKILTLLKAEAVGSALDVLIHSASRLESMSMNIGMYGETAASVCMQYTIMGGFDMLVSAAFIRLPDVASDLIEKREKTYEVVESLRAAFIANLDDLDWLDKKTAKFAAEKARVMGAKMLYPDWVADDRMVERVYADVPQIEHLTRYSAISLALSGWQKVRHFQEIGVKPFSIFWAVPPVLLNMIYNPAANDVAATVAFVQPPMSSSRALGASLFGKLGAVLGHEITHGFDSAGHKLDSSGDPYDWWDEKTKSHFEEKTKCFVDQVGQMKIDGHTMANCFGHCDANSNEPSEGPPGTADHQASVANKTLGENIADVGGVGISWHAYHQWMQEKGEDLPLAGLEYSPAHIFFLEYAGAFCRASTLEYREMMLEHDVHLLHELRVNSALKNSIPFARTFKCAKNTPMNPEQKCRIWGAVK